MKPIYLIDNSNFCYKFKDVHKYAHVEVNGVSVSTSVLTGYIRSLKSNIFDNIVIVLDGVPTKSLELLPSYKGQRMHDDPKGLAIPKLEVIQFLSACGPLLHKNVQVVCSPGQEADQVISSIVHLVTGNLPQRYKFISAMNSRELSSDRMLAYLDNGVSRAEFQTGDYDEVVIGSTDADMAQLQRFPNVFVDLSTSGKKVSMSLSADSVSQVRPELIPLYKSIYGDASDNVPALPLEVRKQDVLSYMDKMFKSFSDVQEFVQSIQSGTTSRFSQLYSYILPFKREFIRNFYITCLEFCSIPSVITFPSYDIAQTIEKYRLRV